MAAPAPAPAPAPEPVAAEASATVAAEVTPVDTTVSSPVAAEAATAEAPPPATWSPSARGDEAAVKSGWKMEFHGYLRAPMRLGMGRRDNPLAGQSANTFHYPVIPDDQYLSWQFTSHNKKDWAEVFLSYGNEWATGVVALQGFNFTDASWNLTNAQFGISQGYVHLKPLLPYENVRFEAKAGVFWARYGMAGKWDAGEYDTYLFGRTHVAGELMRLEFDVNDATTLWFEKGVGVKRPNPSQDNNARFTVLAHGHVGLKLGGNMEFSAHYLHSFAREEDRILPPRNPADGSTINNYQAPNYPSSVMDAPDGSLWVAGADARFELGAFGYLYAGYSHIGASDAIVVAPAIEVLHSFGGGEFSNGVTDNYFGPSCRGFGPYNTMREAPKNTDGQLTSCSLGNGSVDSILAQYEFSVQNFLQQSEGGQKFWGEGKDLKAILYGMVNMVNSDVAMNDGITKLKYGVDLQYQALPWLTVATRYDRVQPHSDFPEQSFSVLSPRLVFKSNWVTREQISLQYSRYIYNQRECAQGVPAFNTSDANDDPGPRRGFVYVPGQHRCVQPPSAPTSPESFGAHQENQDPKTRGAPTTRPDVNVIKIEASMWW